MQPFVILPYVKAGGVHFGMTRDEVAELFETQLPPGVLDVRTGSCTVSLDEMGLFLWFSQDDRCEAVHLRAPSNVRMGNASILGRPFSAFTQFLCRTDSDGVDVRPDRCSSLRWGVVGLNDSASGVVGSLVAFDKLYLQREFRKKAKLKSVPEDLLKGRTMEEIELTLPSGKEVLLNVYMRPGSLFDTSKITPEVWEALESSEKGEYLKFAFPD